MGIIPFVRHAFPVDRHPAGRSLRAAFVIGTALFLLGSLPSTAAESIQWNGFALVRPQTPGDGTPLDDGSLSAQLQLGIDWRPTPGFGGHLHLGARNDSDGSRRGRAGVVEAFLEQNILRGEDRIHLMAGAFFLPTSRENIDSLWETPYTLTSSALNSWFGEEFRPVGFDASYAKRLPTAGTLTAGATLFSGNDTFGALPVDRGWQLHDRWAFLGEHLHVNRTIYTSVSAETDHRLGWSARGKWNNRFATVQLTRIDNRSDGRLYGELFNWATRFNVAGADATWRGWTAVAEHGWGTTAIERRSGRRSYPISASYLLLSRRLPFHDLRASIRADRYEARENADHAVTAALLWEPRPEIRAGIEGIVATGSRRMAVELRYRF